MATTRPDFLVSAEQTLAPVLAIRRNKFDIDAATVVSEAAKSGSVGGLAHREFMHNICMAELHERVSMLVVAAIKAHSAFSAAPSTELLVASKDWIDHKATTEARHVGARLPRPNVAFGDTWTADNLDADVKREEGAAHARLDAEWARLERSRVERAWRWAVRAWRSLSLALTLGN